ncbi:MAG: CRISPR-associated endonuclease Cas2 [Candidatus Heimdallarchaeum endolithica]|uniref:CRISPR-associated endoribonuclease Cas2 n=1 Tax=Candidatus Heimdallarchaeum endolithica TaxID=2876572 RepID=A0A9Y1BU37_9ARCH|nr:MAG: CRISPR-associated endonuclease Cas2 [Candidatus Heimdallarchaeum endolithica]
MEYIICYDISKDEIREKVAEICQNRGFRRIQYSVFYGNVTKNILETTIMEIKEKTKGEQAEIFIGQICEKCAKNKIFYVSEEKKKENKANEEENEEELEPKKVEEKKNNKNKKRERKRKNKTKTDVQTIMDTLKKGVIIL